MFLYVPIDVDPNQPVPVIDDTYEDLLVNAALRQPDPAAENNNNNFGRRNRNEVGEFDEYHKQRGWIDIMSYSHNLATSPSIKNYSRPHVGELTTTFFQGPHSTFFEGICVCQETLPYIILRLLDHNNGKITCTEYLFEHARLTNISVSGGAGGQPVQTASITGLVFTRRYFVFNTDGQILNNYFLRCDRVKDVSERTHKNNHVKSLLDIANSNINRNDLSPEQQAHLQSLSKNSAEYAYATKENSPPNEEEEEERGEEYEDRKPRRGMRR